MSRSKIFLKVLCLTVAFISNLKADQKGSNSAVSIEPFFTFPASPGVPNEMLAFGYFASGFGLQDATTTCSFESIFPVSGNINLHGGQLYLVTDLHLNNISTLVTSGQIICSNNNLELSESVTGIPASFDSTFKNLNVYMNSDLLVSGTVNIKGNCTIDGRWNRLVLDTYANIIIEPGGALTLRNVEIDNVNQSNIRCVDNSGVLILDDIVWTQNGDYTFSNGSILFNDFVTFAGGYNFIYQSVLTSTISSDSTWYVSNMETISIGRQNSVFAREPLYFTDQTATLKLENSTMSVQPFGMHLTQGTVEVDGEVGLSINSTDSTHGLICGDGTTAGNINFILSSAAVLNLQQGHIVKNVTGINLFLTNDVQKNFLQHGAGTFLYLNYDLSLTNINIVQIPGASIITAPGVNIYVTNAEVTIPSIVDYVITGTRQSLTTFILSNGGFLQTKLGTYPLITSVRGTGNIITGPADISGSIIIHDNLSQLTCNIDGQILSNITMNGGSLTVVNNLRLAQGVVLTGSGTVTLNSNNLTFGTSDISLTSSILFNCTTAQINLQGLLSLSSTITVNGNCTINGNGNELRLHSSGKIFIGKNSTVRFKDMYLTGVSGNNIFCSDNSSKIILQDVNWIQNNNYTFTIGQLEIKNICDMNAASNPFVFAYQSTGTCTIDFKSGLFFDHMFTFSFDPINHSQTSLVFTDQTSILGFNNANLYVTRGGLQLLKGNVLISNASSLTIENNAALIIGDSVSSDDCSINFLAGGILDVLQGSIVYNNINPSSWNMVNIYSILRMESETTLQLHQPLSLGDGRLLLSVRASLQETPTNIFSGTLELF